MGSGWETGIVIATEVIIQGSNDGLFVYNGTPGTGKLLLSIAPIGGTDPYGNTYPQGLAGYGNLGTITSVGVLNDKYIQIQSSNTAQIITYSPDSATWTTGSLQSLSGNGQIVLTAPQLIGDGGNGLILTFSPAHPANAKNSQLLLTDDLDLAVPVQRSGAWIPLSFNTGFQSAKAASNGFDPAARWVTANRIELRGEMQNTGGTALTSGDQPITLPTSMRPTGHCYFSGGTALTATTIEARIRVSSASVGGQIQLNYLGATGPTWVSLDGIAYDLS